MKNVLFIIAVFSCVHAFSQGDFLLLKKKDIVVQSFIKGSYFTCQLTNGQWVEGTIKTIKDDSVFMEQMNVQQVATFWGTARMDTLHYGIAKLALHDIHALPYKEHGISIVNNGSLFTIGAGGYIVLNVINGLSQNESVTSSKNLTNLGIAAAVFVFGEILHWTHPKSIVLGKKYQLYSTASIPSK